MKNGAVLIFFCVIKWLLGKQITYDFEMNDPFEDIFQNIFYCMRSVRIWSFSGPFFPAFEPNTDIHTVSHHVQSKCDKMRTWKTLNTDTFHAAFVMCWNLTHNKFQILLLRLFVTFFLIFRSDRRISQVSSNFYKDNFVKLSECGRAKGKNHCTENEVFY